MSLRFLQIEMGAKISWAKEQQGAQARNWHRMSGELRWKFRERECFLGERERMNEGWLSRSG